LLCYCRTSERRVEAGAPAALSATSLGHNAHRAVIAREAVMRFRVVRANIPDALRVELEEYGEAVVAQILGRPYTHHFEQTAGVPSWVKSNEERRPVLAWLREQHHREDRRRTISELMELSILAFVAVETVISAAQFVC
jgi:hypothetical protein